MIDTFSKYSWVVPLKDKKGITITGAFQKILGKSGRKPNKLWVDRNSNFYNRSMNSWLHNNDKKIYIQRIMKENLLEN